MPHAAALQQSDLLYASPFQVGTLPVGTEFNITIRVANFEQFNGWSIHVGTNSSIINPVNFTIVPNIFSENSSGTPIELNHCVNNSGASSNCSTDTLGGNGVIWSSVSDLGGTAIGDGLLFTITYHVTGNGYSDINIFGDKISNGSTGAVSHTTTFSAYGTKPIRPDFTIAANPADIAITLSQSKNVTENATIILTSFDNFTGMASFSVSTALPVSFNPDHVTLPKNGTTTSTIMITATNSTASTQYFVNATATIGSRSHSIILTVTVNPVPDFVMSVLPSLLKVHATNSGSSIVTLDTQSGYSGPVHLRLDVPKVPGLTASLGATDFQISPGQPATTVFAVRTPASEFPFKYQINITASSSHSTHNPFIITVKPPSSDFNFQIGAPSYVIQAGKSLTITLNSTSVDYFRGHLFFLASSLSGIKSTFTRPSVALDYGTFAISRIDYGNSSSSQMTISTDANLSPGIHNINVTALGTTFLGVPVNHSIIVTVTIVVGQAVLSILSLPPITYFGTLGVLWVAVIGAAIREMRRPKPKRFLT